MKFYIAGVSISPQLKDFNFRYKAALVKNFIKEINIDAKAEFGTEEVTIIIALQEYAFTQKAMPTAAKKEFLELLSQTVKQFNNIILVPGSISSYQALKDYPDPEKKIAKILSGYSHYDKDPSFEDDDEYQENKKQALTRVQQYQTKVKSVGSSDEISLQHSAYLLANIHGSFFKFKHSKSRPIDELHKLDKNADKGIYQMVVQDPIKKIKIDPHNLDIRVTICREHVYLKPTHFPFLEIFISDPEDYQTQFLYGALNICMDSWAGLNVLIMNNHPKASLITKVIAAEYRVSGLNDISKVEDKVKEFSSPHLPNEQSNQNNTQSTSESPPSVGLKF